MNCAAAATLSFITFCIEPRLKIRPDPFVACISKWRRQPWSPITAKPDDLADRGRARQRDLLISTRRRAASA